jgi:hypothetical protein
MRKIYLFVFTSIFAFTKAQNADLTFDQTWVPGTIYTAVEPVGWLTSNVLTAPLISFPLPNTNPTTVSQGTTLFISSPNSARIITKKVAPGLASSLGFGDTTGFMITGKLIGLSSFSTGYSYATKSAQLDFQYNYQPASASDRGLVAVVFLKRNGANRDTIATGYTVLNASPLTSTFQNGTVLMVYKNVNGPAPDTVIIGAASSVGNVKNLLGDLNIATPPAAINSTLYLDDLAFSGTVGLAKNSLDEKYVRVGFNSNNETIDITISNNYVGTTKLKVYDVTGKLVMSKNMTSTTNRLEVKELQSGMYLYSLTDNKSEKPVKSGKLIISK